MIATAIALKQFPDGWRVLLIKSSAGRWIFPKGHVENEEFPGSAAAREMEEESGWRGWYNNEVIAIYEDQKGRVDCFLITGAEQHAEPEEGRDPRWFPIPAAKVALRMDRNEEEARGMIAALDKAENEVRDQERLGTSAR